MIKNTQRPELRTSDPDRLQVHSIFHTIQGEGPFAGRPAIFVRLAGCNLQCPLCDTEYTSERGHFNIATLVDEIQHCGFYPAAPLIVITGGEPFRQPIGLLVQTLAELNHHVQIETNGTLAPDDLLLKLLGYKNSYRNSITIVCSPKTQRVHPSLLPHIDAFKYVATAGSLDPVRGLPMHALEHPTRGHIYWPGQLSNTPIYLQPVDEQDEAANAKNLRACLMSCMKHNYTLCIQLHKIIGVP